MITERLDAFILTIAKPNSLRAKHARQHWDESGLNFQFVTGLTATDTNINVYYNPRKNLFYYKRPLANVEIATYLGHRKLWQEFLKSKKPYGLMLEDDAAMSDVRTFPATIRDIMQSSQCDIWDILKLFDYSPKKIIARKKFGNTDIICTKYPAYAAVAYIISRKAAKKLLERPYIYRPVDEDLARPWEFKLRVWSTAQNIILEKANDLGGSLIVADRVKLDKQASKNRILYPIKRNFLEFSKTLHSISYQRNILKNLADNKKRS